MAIILPTIWMAGVPLLVALFFYRPGPMLILIGLLAWPRLKPALSGNSQRPPDYHAVAPDTRINYAVMYLGLGVFLAAMSDDIHRMLRQ